MLVKLPNIIHSRKIFPPYHACSCGWHQKSCIYGLVLNCWIKFKLLLHYLPRHCISGIRSSLFQQLPYTHFANTGVPIVKMKVTADISSLILSQCRHGVEKNPPEAGLTRYKGSRRLWWCKVSHSVKIQSLLACYGHVVLLNCFSFSGGNEINNVELDISDKHHYLPPICCNS